MEKKTIGGFISALRKANGMTQKELAILLNVSDKTVSRWERDDGAPDLSIIPAIAEIFGVTCDELLRGERKSPMERAEISDDTETSPKGEKQRQRLLKSTLSQYRNLTFITMGISVMGMIAALICNLAFLKAVLGFLIGAIFFAASIVCQAIFVNKAFQRVEDAGRDTAPLSGYKRKVIGLAEKSIGLTVCLIGFTFPLILENAYLGLKADSLLIWGSVCAVLFMMVYAVILYFLNHSLLKKGVFSFSDRELATYHQNRTLQKKCSISFIIILIATLLFHVFGGEMIWSIYNISSAYGTVFDDYESFVSYMEQDVPANSYEAGYNGSVAVPIPDEQVEASVYYDEYGNEISEKEALTRTIEDSNGSIVCTYMERNENVSSIRYTPRDGTVLPIQVITMGDYQIAARLSNLINLIYCILYPVELLAVLLIYFKSRIK